MTDYVSRGALVQAALDDSTQYATLYFGYGLRPVGTLCRRRVLDRTSPVWELYDTDGHRLRSWRLPRSYQGLVDDCALTLLREGLIEESLAPR